MVRFLPSSEMAINCTASLRWRCFGFALHKLKQKQAGPSSFLSFTLRGARDPQASQRFLLVCSYALRILGHRAFGSVIIDCQCDSTLVQRQVEEALKKADEEAAKAEEAKRKVKSK
eukprot:GHVT01037464.1.p2 GENE.GHVT01037464.1~~GHVT01037464.1.p2  ORF type:complete len:116 (-),score=17.52 GHVT01037464.1:1551-1898(-)